MNNSQSLSGSDLKHTLFVSAMNVHIGGGRSLLSALLQSLPAGLRVVALLDARMDPPSECSSDLEIRMVRPTAFSRMQAERWLAREARENDVVLCFGNLPPLFRTQGKIVVFMQNRYLVDQVSLASFPLKTRLRLMAERCWLASRAASVDAFMVQTPTMQNLTKMFVRGTGTMVRLLPFADGEPAYARSISSERAGRGQDFIYVASGEPHKNHRRLIEAWCELAREGLFPSLWLTLNQQSNRDLCLWIDEQTARWDLRVNNLGVQPHARIIDLYRQVDALIYPSTFESFGMPLIEARQSGIAVIAAEMDYVRDVLDPEESFDPFSSVSIARAVKRFLGKGEQSLPLASARMFMQAVLEKCE